MSLSARRIATSYALSGVLHLAVLSLLVLLTVPSEWITREEAIETAIGSLSDDAPARIDPVEEVEADDVAEVPSTPVDALQAVDPTDSRLAEFTRRRLDRSRQEAAEESTPEQLQKLESLARQLGSISDTASVTEVAETIAPWIGSDKARATSPADPATVAGPFDIETAQISEVLKEESDGSIEYVAVMIDAAGRTQQTPLEPADGESLYEVFRLMKQFPLLEAVYRKTVMQMLDRLMDEDSGPDASAEQSDQNQGEQSEQN